jgi:hypothetical protein
MADYNTRVVFAGVTALGAAGGLVGRFCSASVRLSDTVSHYLPGIAIASLLSKQLFLDVPRRSCWLARRRLAPDGNVVPPCPESRDDDAALAIVLSVFFGWASRSCHHPATTHRECRRRAFHLWQSGVHDRE